MGIDNFRRLGLPLTTFFSLPDSSDQTSMYFSGVETAPNHSILFHVKSNMTTADAA
jgi:hypothetical protein